MSNDKIYYSDHSALIIDNDLQKMTNNHTSKIPTKHRTHLNFYFANKKNNIVIDPKLTSLSTKNIETLKQIKELVEKMSVDTQKVFEKGNRSASIRARKNAQEVKALLGVFRKVEIKIKRQLETKIKIDTFY